MTKLEEAASAWLDEHYYGKSEDSFTYLLKKTELVAIFIAGALRLLEEAKTISYEDMKRTTDERLPDMRALELMVKLKELCKKDK